MLLHFPCSDWSKCAAYLIVPGRSFWYAFWGHPLQSIRYARYAAAKTADGHHNLDIDRQQLLLVFCVCHI